MSGMRVYGHTITEEQIAAALKVMAGTFQTRDVELALSEAGVSDSLAVMRGADRLLQRERKAGRIRFANSRWERVA